MFDFSIFHKNFLQLHDIDTNTAVTSQEDLVDHHCIQCQIPSLLFTDNSYSTKHVLFANESIVCLLTCDTCQFEKSPSSLPFFPDLKIHESILEYTSLVRHNRTTFAPHISFSGPLELIIESNPCCDLSDLVLSLTQIDIDDVETLDHAISRRWSNEVELAINATARCYMQVRSIQAKQRDLALYVNVEGLNIDCLILYIYHVSHRKEVLRLSLVPTHRYFNYDTGRYIRGGDDIILGRKFKLDGSGQICGVADTGIDESSCFFIDDTDSKGIYNTPYVNRSGAVESERRKIIQYYSFADESDSQGGHGTHVCATIVGASNGMDSELNGIASGAKIAFFDIGFSNSNFLTIPSLLQLFSVAYNAGARIHSNSWGNYAFFYSRTAFELDKFTFDHPDFAVVFAAGNLGAYGRGTISSPGLAKNAITVGSISLHDSFSDLPFSHHCSQLSAFSSVGPTIDGRLKPDVVAPGDYLMSAYSSSYDNQRKFLSSNTKKQYTSVCSVHQMSGTSMSAPVVASACLLIRQYFMDPQYWASNCNQRYQQCRKGSLVPSGYLIKALVIHAGQVIDQFQRQYSNISMEQRNPNNIQGYGSVVLSNIFPSSSNNEFDLIVFDKLEIQAQQTLHWTVSFNKHRQHSVPLKVTIAWYDLPSILSSVTSLLVFDFDLMVVDPKNRQWFGNCGLNCKRSDRVNVNEQVTIPLDNFAGVSRAVFHVYVRSRFLYGRNAHNISMVITTSGYVRGPTLDSEWPEPLLPMNDDIINDNNVAKDQNDEKTTTGDITDDLNSTCSINPWMKSNESLLDKEVFLFNIENITLSSGAFDVDKDSSTPSDYMEISTFKAMGKLSSIHLHLTTRNDFVISGINAWLLAIVVKSPCGRIIQVGGYKKIWAKSSLFLRRWPDDWIVAPTSQMSFQSRRDVLEAFACESHNRTDSNMWSMGLYLGYPYPGRTVSYYGNVSLHFAIDRRDESPANSIPPSLLNVSKPMIHGIVFILALFAILLIALRFFLKWYRNLQATSRERKPIVYHSLQNYGGIHYAVDLPDSLVLESAGKECKEFVEDH